MPFYSRLPLIHKVTMDAIRIRPGLFTDRKSLDKLLEPFRFDIQDIRMTKKQSKLAKTEQDAKYILIVGNKQYRFVESSLFNYDIYLEEKQDIHMGRNDIAEMVTNQDLCVFGDAIAIRSKLEGCRSAKKVDLKEFVTELMRVGSVDDTFVVFPMRPKTKVLSSSPKLRNTGMLKNMGKLAILWKLHASADKTESHNWSILVQGS